MLGSIGMAYRGYLISTTLMGHFFVEKDGQLICWAHDVADAKRKIDGLLD